MSDILACTNLFKTYQEDGIQTDVLRGVNFGLRSHELVSIVGGSGSGKSTLLHILGTLDTPSRGDVLLHGSSLFAIAPDRQAEIRNKNLGFIYQFHHLLSDFSALENVAIPTMIAGDSLKVAKKKAAQLLSYIGLSHRLEHRPSQLSGGERQRTAIARAIINSPDVVLADEPTGNLDHKTASSIHSLMRELSQSSGTTFLIVTHDNELASKTDRQLSMQDGVLV